MSRAPVALVALFVLASGCSPGSEVRSRPDASTGLATRWKEDPREPYPFSGDIPPLEATPVDGLYARNAPVAEVGEPVPCRRCPPYKIYAGEARLRLDRGRFYVEEDASQFGSEGHFVVAGDSITFFNDPICPAARVAYAYNLDEGVLTFAFRRDPCAFQNLRGKYLTRYPWTAVDGSARSS